MKDSMQTAIHHAAVLIDGSDNYEYMRGMCELLASLNPIPTMDTAGRATWFEAQIRRQLTCDALPFGD